MFRGLGLGAAFFSALAVSGCAEGVDFEFNSPLLEAAGVNLTSKQREEPNLKENAPLVVPPSTELPPPGEGRQALAAGQWPDDPDQRAKRQAELEAEEKARYCREGDWSDKAGIEEFQKNIGKGQRCQSKLGEALNKSYSRGADEEPAAN